MASPQDDRCDFFHKECTSEENSGCALPVLEVAGGPWLDLALEIQATVREGVSTKPKLIDHKG